MAVILTFSGALCNGSIQLCNNCSEVSVGDHLSNNIGHCRPFSTNNIDIVGSKNKSSVFHNDSNLDCCWRVYSENGYKGNSRLISGREKRRGIKEWVETKCTDVDFPILSLKRVCKTCSEEP